MPPLNITVNLFQASFILNPSGIIISQSPRPLGERRWRPCPRPAADSYLPYTCRDQDRASCTPETARRRQVGFPLSTVPSVPPVATATSRQTAMPKFASGHSLPTPTPVRELGWTTALFGADHSTVYPHTWNQVTVVWDRAHSDPYLSGVVARSPTDHTADGCRPQQAPFCRAM